MTRLDALSLSRIARFLAHADVALAEQVAGSLLGVRIAIGAPIVRREHPTATNALAVEFGGSVPFTLEVPGALAAWAVDRALGDKVELQGVEAGLAPRDEMSFGVIAYVVARFAQALPGALQVTDVHAMRSSWASDTKPATCIEIPLVVNHQPTQLRAWIPNPASVADIVQQVSRNPLLIRSLLRERGVLSAQLIAPLPLPTASALRLDDVRILRAPGVRFTPQGIEGNVRLCVLGSRQQVWHGTLQLDRIELEERVTMKDDDLTTASRETTLAAIQSTNDLTPIADAPLELSVEIARFTLPLGEIAALCRGEVLVTGRPVGQHVTLRAGTRAVATGELVDVEGAVGVRILDVAK